MSPKYRLAIYIVRPGAYAVRDTALNWSHDKKYTVDEADLETVGTRLLQDAINAVGVVTPRATEAKVDPYELP